MIIEMAVTAEELLQVQQFILGDDNLITTSNCEEQVKDLRLTIRELDDFPTMTVREEGKFIRPLQLIKADSIRGEGKNQPNCYVIRLEMCEGLEACRKHYEWGDADGRIDLAIPGEILSQLFRIVSK